MNFRNLPKNIVDYLPEAGGVLGGTAGLALGGLAPMGAFAGYGGGKVLEDYFGPMVGLGQQDAGDALYEASLAGMGGSAVQDVLSLLNNINIATKKFPTPVKEVPSQFSRDPISGRELNVERTKRVLPEVSRNPIIGSSGGIENVSKFHPLASQGINPVFHETSPSSAIDMLGGDFGRAGHLEGLWVSPEDYLALGQKGQGAIMRLNTEGLYGVPRIDKAGSRAMSQVTGKVPELQITKTEGLLRDIIDSILMRRNMKVSPYHLKRLLTNLKPVKEIGDYVKYAFR